MEETKEKMHMRMPCRCSVVHTSHRRIRRRRPPGGLKSGGARNTSFSWLRFTVGVILLYCALARPSCLRVRRGAPRSRPVAGAPGPATDAFCAYVHRVPVVRARSWGAPRMAWFLCAPRFFSCSRRGRTIPCLLDAPKALDCVVVRCRRA